MLAHELYKDIADRTQGDVYIGVVGPVRTGKSTFIQKFMEKLVIPGIENPHIRSRVLDELPQSGSGRMVMTTKPAFVPNEAVDVNLMDEHPVHLRLIDCVGYMIDGVIGTQDGESVRMVKTPWLEHEIPFEQAAEIGTQKVISEHSTIGLVVTTDGSVTDLPRAAYVEAETRVVQELKKIDKPFIVVLNTENPSSVSTQALRNKLEADYGVPVIAMNIVQMEEENILQIIERVLDQFEVVSMELQVPEWLCALDESHPLVDGIIQAIISQTPKRMRIGDVQSFCDNLRKHDAVENPMVKSVNHGNGTVHLQLTLVDGLFNRILTEHCGTEIRNDAHLLTMLRDLVQAKREYDHIADALQSVKTTGYGLVPPKLEELTLQEPEMIKRGGQFGVRLRASAPSLHLIRVDIQTEVSPVVGTEQQSEEMIRYLMEGFEQDPQQLWQSNLFGKPLADLVREGLSNKLMHMPTDTQLKMQQTLERIINEGNGTVVCFLL